MVSNILLLHIDQRLVEIFGWNSNIPFAGLTVIFCGDFFQLLPIQARPIYSDYNDEWQNLVHLWKMFKLAELTEVMRPKGDDTFVDLLNNIRTASINPTQTGLFAHYITWGGGGGYLIDRFNNQSNFRIKAGLNHRNIINIVRLSTMYNTCQLFYILILGHIFIYIWYFVETKQMRVVYLI